MKLNRVELYKLEDRVLFEAAAVEQAAEAEAVNEQTAKGESAEDQNDSQAETELGGAEDVISEFASVEFPPDAVTETEAAVPERTLVIINSSIAAGSEIINDLGGNYEILRLEPGTDALDTINVYLDAHNDTEYSALHIISHGNDGYFTLNGERIDNSTLNPADWKAIGEHLTDDADILIYGCDTAANDEGKALIRNIADLTGADVAASADTTGADGDWDLEYQTGLIEAATLAPSADDTYSYSLSNTAVITVTAGTDKTFLATAAYDAETGYDGEAGITLREAIHMTQKHADYTGKDITIKFSDTLEEVVIGGEGMGTNTSGLNITSGNIVIDGDLGNGETIVIVRDTNSFVSIKDAAVTWENLTLKNANPTAYINSTWDVLGNAALTVRNVQLDTPSQIAWATGSANTVLLDGVHVTGDVQKSSVALFSTASGGNLELTLKNSTFENLHRTIGLLQLNSSMKVNLTIENSSFRNNVIERAPVADGTPAVVNMINFSNGGNLMIRDTEFRGNSVDGNLVFLNMSDAASGVDFSGCLFVNNTATDRIMQLTAKGDISIQDSCFVGNSNPSTSISKTEDQMITMGAGSYFFRNNMFAHNSGFYKLVAGGNINTHSLSIDGCTFLENAAGELLTSESAAKSTVLSNTLFARNNSSSLTGWFGGKTSLINCTFVENNAKLTFNNANSSYVYNTVFDTAMTITGSYKGADNVAGANVVDGLTVIENTGIKWNGGDVSFLDADGNTQILSGVEYLVRSDSAAAAVSGTAVELAEKDGIIYYSLDGGSSWKISGNTAASVAVTDADKLTSDVNGLIRPAVQQVIGADSRLLDVSPAPVNASVSGSVEYGIYGAENPFAGTVSVTLGSISAEMKIALVPGAAPNGEGFYNAGEYSSFTPGDAAVTAEGYTISAAAAEDGYVLTVADTAGASAPLYYFISAAVSDAASITVTQKALGTVTPEIKLNGTAAGTVSTDDLADLEITASPASAAGIPLKLVLVNGDGTTSDFVATDLRGGTYTVRYDWSDSRAAANYGAVFGTAELNVISGNLNVTVTAGDTGSTAVYGGDGVTLTGVAVGGTGEYSYQWYMYDTDGNAAAVAGATGSTLTITDVNQSGKYYLRVSTSDGGSAVSADAEIAITPLDVTVGVYANTGSVFYTGAAHSVSGYTLIVSSDLYAESNVVFSGTAADMTVTRTDAGTSTKYLTADMFTLADNDNFNVELTIGASELRLTVSNATIKVNAPNVGVYYNGTAQTFDDITVTTVNNQPATVEYSADGGKTYSTEKPEFTEMGSYKVNYRVSAPNHTTLSGPFYVTVKESTTTFVNALTDNASDGKTSFNEALAYVNSGAAGNNAVITFDAEVFKDANVITLTKQTNIDNSLNLTVSVTIDGYLDENTNIEINGNGGFIFGKVDVSKGQDYTLKNISFTNAKGNNGTVFKLLTSTSATAADHAVIVFDNVTMHDITTGGTGDGGLIAGRGSKYVDWEFRDSMFFNIVHNGAGAVFDIGYASSASNNTVLIERCLFDSTRTSSTWGGGAFSVVYSDIVVKDSSFINSENTNMQPSRGGLMTLEGGGSFLMENCTVVNNTAYHGIILHDSNTGGIQVLNSVFYGNQVAASAAAGGAVVYGRTGNSHVTVANSVFLGNTVASGYMIGAAGAGKVSAYNSVYDGTLANKDLTSGDGTNKTGEGWTMADLYASTDLVMGTDGGVYTVWDGSSAGHLDSVTDNRIYFMPAENSPLLNSGVQVAADSATVKRNVFIKTGDTWTSITYTGAVTENADAPADDILLKKDMLGNSLSYTDDAGTHYAMGSIQTKTDAAAPEPPAVRTVTVSFDGNVENTGTMASRELTSETAGVTFTNTFSLDGWTFMGFDTDAVFIADSTLDYAAVGNTVTLTEAQVAALLEGGQDITLFAIWKKDIAITYSAADGTAAPENMNVTLYNGAGYEWTAPAVSTAPAAWTALGWRTDTIAGDAAYAAGAKEIILTDMAFNAVYSRTVSISYNGNGADNSMQNTGATQYRNVDTAAPVTLNIAENTLTREGYIFKGWSLTQDGAVISDTSFTVNGADASVKTLYAVWEAEAGGGDESSNPVLLYTVTGDTRTLVNAYATVQDAINGAADTAAEYLICFNKSYFDNGGSSVFSISTTLSIGKNVNITIDGDVDGDGIGDIIFDGRNTYEGNESLNTGVSILNILSGSDVTLRNLTFQNGYAAGGGVGGAITNGGTLTIQRSLFRDNYAEYSGGAVNSTGALFVEDSTFYRNQGEGDGGAIALSSSVKAVIVNTTFAENSSPKSGAGAINAGNGATLYLLNNVFDGQTVKNGRENIGNSPNITNSAMYYCVYHDAYPRGNGGYSTMDGNLNTAYGKGADTLTTVAVKGSLITDGFSNNALVTAAQAHTNGTLVGKIGTDYYYLDHTDADSANWMWVKVTDTSVTHKYDGNAETFGLGADAEILKTSQNGVDRTADMTEFSAGAYQRFLQINASGYSGVADGNAYTVSVSVNTPDNSPVTITYKGTGESAFDETPPEYTAPGSYTVEYTVTGAQETISGTLTVTLYAPLVVNTDKDPADFVLTDSEVSLREAISIVAGNPELYKFISFSEDMKGKTILLADTLTVNSAIFTIDGDVDGDGIGDIILDGGGKDGAGGIQLMNIAADSNVTLRNLTIQNGYSTADGGAIANAGTLLIQKTLLQENRADGNGGAVYNNGKLYVEDSTFYHNTAFKKGGAIAATKAVAVVNSTFAENTATSNAGAISALNAYPSMVLVNNVFDGNKGGSRINVGDDPSQSESALVYNVYNGSGTMDGNFGNTNNHKFGNSESNANLSLLTQPAEFENGAVITAGNALTSGTLVGKIGTDYYYLDHSAADSANWRWVNAGSENISYAYSNVKEDGYGLGATAEILAMSQNGGNRTDNMTAFAAGSYSFKPEAVILKEILLYTVGTETPIDSFHTVQEAIDAAESGTEYVIRFNSDYFKAENYTIIPDSTISITGGLSITIDGDVDGDGIGDIIFDGGRKDGAGGIQIMNIASGSTVTLQGLTFRNAYSDASGGAVYNAGTLTLNNVDFLNNSAQVSGGAVYTEGTLNVNGGSFEGSMVTGSGKPHGAAIYLNKGTLTIDGTAFTGNGNGKGWGGGIYTDSKNATVINISNAVFEANKGAVWGAAIYAENATIAIDNSMFRGNTGANTIYAADITIDKSEFINNTGATEGGAIETTGNTVISNSSFIGNNGSWGAAVYFQGQNSKNAVIINSEFLDNGPGGKAIYSERVFTAVNTTIVNNAAGAVHLWYGTAGANLINCILAGNGANDVYVSNGAAVPVMYYSVYGSANNINAGTGAIQNAAADNYTDYTTNKGFQPVNLKGDAAENGTLVGKIGNVFYYKSGNQWLIVGGTDADAIAFTTDAAANYGLGTADGTEVYTADIDGTSRVNNLNSFSMGAYAVDAAPVNPPTPPAGEDLNVTISVAGTASKVYDGKDITLTAEPTGGEGSYLYKWYKDGSTEVYSESESITVTDVADSGSYRVVVAAGDETADAASDVSITNAVIKVTAPNVTGIADGTTEYSITVTPETVNSQTATVSYGTAAGVYDLSASPVFKEGTHTVYYQVTAPNHETYTGSATITLTAKPVEIDRLKVTATEENDTDATITLAEALAYAAGQTGAQTITFDKNFAAALTDGVYTISNTLKLTGSGHNITIDGDADGDGTADIILDGGRKDGAGGVQILNIASGSTFTVKNITFRNAYAASHGGAVFAAANTTLNVINTDFLNNAVGSSYGAAIYCAGSCILNISGSEFRGNSASWGAALYLNGTSSGVLITDSVFADNISANAGAICNYSSTPLTVINSTFVNNKGAINPWFSAGTTTVINSIFVGNGAKDIVLSGSGTAANFISSVYEKSAGISADANSIQKAAADVFRDYSADAGFQPVKPVGEITRKGTLVGRIGDAFYYKSGDQWLKVGGTDADAVAFSADAAANYGLGTADGTEVYTADIDGTSRVENLDMFSMGAYFVKAEVAAELTVTVSAGDTEGDTADGKATYGNTVTLTATVSGGEPGADGYTYQWYNGDGAVSGATESTLKIQNVADSGSYYVIVTDAAGTEAGTQNSAQSVQIQKAVITVKVENMSAVYGNAAGTIKYTYEGFKNGETAVTAAGFKEAVASTTYKQGDNAGTYDLTASGADAENYSFSYQKGILTVGRRNATITLQREYDGTAAFAATAVKDAFSTASLYGNDAAGLTVGAFSMKSADATALTDVSSLATVTGDKAGNYNFTVKAEITAYSGEILVTITGNTAEKIYSGAEQKAEGYKTGINNSLYTADNFTFSGTAVAKGTDAGSYAMGLTAAMFSNSSKNFSNVKFAVTDGSLTIEKATVTVKLEGNHTGGTYNGQAYTASGYTVKEIVNNSAAAYTANDFILNGTASVSRTDAGKSVMGLTAAMFSNSKTKNYDVTFEVTDGYVEVAKKQLTLGADMFTVASKVYDGDTDMKGETKFSWGNQIVSGDKVDLTFTATLNSKDVADAEQVTFSGFSISNSNYELKSTADVVKTQTGLVTKKAVTVEWTGGNQFSWVYDGKANKPDASLETGVTGETAAVTVDTYSGNTAGTYSDAGTYTAKAVIAGINLNNYNVQNDSITYTITQAQAVLSGIAVKDNLVYDSEAVTAGTDGGMDLSVSVSGVAGAAAPAGAVTWKFYTDAAHTNEIAAPEDAGEYYVVATLAADKNYLGTSVDGTFTVARKDMTVNLEREYDGTDKFSGITVTDTATGLCGGDEVAIADFTTGNRNAGEYKNVAAAVGGSDAANYNITVNARINKYSGEIVVEITGNSATDYVYNGMEQRVEGYSHTIGNSLYTTQDFTFSGSDVIAEKNAGTYNMGLAADQFANNSGNFSNVKFNVADGQMVISPKEATITAGSANKIYDGTPLTDKGYSTDGFVDGEGIKSAVIKGSQTEVGSSPNKVVSYVFADGTLASNYIITEVRGTLTVLPSGDAGSNPDTLQGAPGQSSVNTNLAVSLSGIVSSTEAQRPGSRNYLMTMEQSMLLNRFENSAVSVPGGGNLSGMGKVLPLSVIEQRMLEDMASPEIGTVRCGETAVSDHLNGDGSDVLEQFFNHTEDELEMERLKELLRNVNDYSFSELDLDSMFAKSEQFKDEIDFAIDEMLTV